MTGAFRYQRCKHPAVMIGTTATKLDGDASLELVVIQQSGSSKTLRVLELDTLPDGHNSIDTITNGLGAVTNIEYSPLSDSDHYQRIEGINSVTTTENQCFPNLNFGQNICFDVPVATANANDFYRNINDPFYDRGWPISISRNDCTHIRNVWALNPSDARQ